MKLAKATIDNLLGVASLSVDLDSTITLFAGSNFSGKSSIRDAIEMALTGEFPRVSRKQAPELLHDGADAGGCEVTDADGEIWRVIINAKGKVVDSQKGAVRNPSIAYALNGQRFAGSDPNDRRALLYGLMGVKTGHEDIAARMLKLGCDVDKVKRITPMLRAGFEAACKDAKAKATEGKGSWSTVTGEAYGPEKAKTWRAQIPVYDKARVQELSVHVDHAGVALGQWQQQVGTLRAQAQRRAQQLAKLPGLAAQVDLIERTERKLAVDQQALAEWAADLKKTREAAGDAPRVGLIHDLAKALRDTLFFVGKSHEFLPNWQKTLATYEDEYGSLEAHAAGSEKARARLRQVQASHDLMASSVANDERNLAGLKKAEQEHAAIVEELAQPYDAKALETAQQHIAAIEAMRAEAGAELDKLRALKAAAETADKLTEQAAAIAADIAQWTAIGAALAPEGIPAALVAEALGPLNDRLEQTALDTDWERVSIDADMTVRSGPRGRQYALLSESERWRADAMIAEAIAYLSGTKLLMLDRFDVLDMPGRLQLLGWLDTLGGLGEIETALLFGTLRAPPHGLPPSVRAHWIEGGALAAQAMAAEA